MKANSNENSALNSSVNLSKNSSENVNLNSNLKANSKADLNKKSAKSNLNLNENLNANSNLNSSINLDKKGAILNLNSNVNLSKNGANSSTNLKLDEIKIQRQSLQNRAVHWGIALSTFLLIITGLFQLPISKRYMINELPLMAWSGDYHISLVAHYVGAVVFCVFISFHLYFHIARREFDIFPKRGDFKKSAQIIKAMLTNGEEPPSEKYLPEQRLAYAFIGFTLLLLLVTGLIKSFKNLAGFNLSESVYFWVAQLHNLGFVLIIFGIIGHLAAFIFKANRPLLSSMFSGKVSAKYILHRHTLSKDECERAEKAIKKAQKDKK